MDEISGSIHKFPQISIYFLNFCFFEYPYFSKEKSSKIKYRIRAQTYT